MSPWLRYVVALVVFGHGLIYVVIGASLPGPVAGWSGRSWLLGPTLTGDALKTVFVSLHVMAGLALIGCAVAIAFAPSLAGWWRALAIAGALAGLTGFAVFWDGQMRLLVEEGAIGVAVSLVLLIAALAAPQAVA